MRYKTLFRLAMKFLGLWLIISGITGLISMLINVLSVWFQLTGINIYTLWQLSGLFQIGVGLYLFFSGKWIVDLAIPSNRPYCHECGYELSHVTHTKCPECGTALAAEQITQVNKTEVS